MDSSESVSPLAFGEHEMHPDLAHLLEQLEEGLILLDRDWRITYANTAARRISRIEPQHLNSASHWELYPATIGTPQEQIYRTSMEQRLSLDHSFYYPPQDLWIELRTFPTPNGIAVRYRDISPLKRAESARADTTHRLEQVFEGTSDAVFTLDRTYNFNFLNRRAEELLKRSGNLLGKNIWTTYPDIVYPDSPFVTHYRAAMEDRVSGRFEAYYPEPFNFWLCVEARPFEGGIIVFFRDITAERVAADALRRKSQEAERQAAEIEAVYRTAPIGLGLFDPVEFRYIRVNERQAAFFGLRPEELMGRAVTDMAPIPGLRELFEQVAAGTPVINHLLEGQTISHPGENRYWTVNYRPVLAADGSVQAISSASLEVTQQKKAELALIQSEKLAAVGRLATSISHEINNPLESVTNLLFLIAAQQDLSRDVREWVELAESELARVSQIATQTLRFHRQTSRATHVTAAQLIGPVLDIFQGRLANSGINVTTRYATEEPVLCLENEIRQVLANLIGNALDAMRTGGVLSLRAHRATDAKSGAGGIRIVVADTGHGMTPTTRARIFEAFFTTKELNGTGLGLWISSEIIQRHHGRFSVRSSQAEHHHGTVFTLFLPLTQAPDRTA